MRPGMTTEGPRMTAFFVFYKKSSESKRSSECRWYGRHRSATLTAHLSFMAEISNREITRNALKSLSRIYIRVVSCYFVVTPLILLTFMQLCAIYDTNRRRTACA